jgi:hypothetical protein
MVDIANIIGKQSGYEELLMPSGELKPGVQIIDKQSGDVVAEGERFPSRNLQPGDAGFLDDSFSGDYCEVRDIILLETRHSIAKAVLKMDARRIMLAREHLLQFASYHGHLTEVCIQIALILTRILAGDFKYDLEELPDDRFDIGEDEEEAIVPKSEGKKPLEDDWGETLYPGRDFAVEDNPPEACASCSC